MVLSNWRIKHPEIPWHTGFLERWWHYVLRENTLHLWSDIVIIDSNCELCHCLQYRVASAFIMLGKKKICLFCDGQLWGAFVMWVNMTCSKSLQTWCAASAVYWYPIIHDAKGATLRSAACTVLNDKIMFRSPFTFDALKIFIYTYEWQNTGIDELIRLVFDCYYCMTWH